jgi:hypothetical protein
MLPTRETGWEKDTRSVGPLAQGLIGVGLKSMYDDLLRQPVPDHLTSIIRRLGA